LYRIGFVEYYKIGEKALSRNIVPTLPVVFYQYSWDFWLTLHAHVSYWYWDDKLILNIRKFFYIFKPLKYVLCDNLKLMVYKALVQSIMSYGIAFWGSAYKIHKTKLETTLNLLIQFLFNKPGLHSTTSLYKDLGTFNLDSLHIYYVCTLLFKHKNTVILPYHTHNTRF